MTAPLHWEVLAILGSGHALTIRGFVARCHHRHATRDEAIACPWEPVPWPEVCDLLVRQVRTEGGREGKPSNVREQGRLFS